MLMKVSNGKCIICGQNKETLNHLFWECKAVKSFLDNVNQLIGSLRPENSFVLNYKYMVLGNLNKRYKTLILKPSIIILQLQCYNYSNEICTLLQLCKEECGWIPDPILFHVRRQYIVTNMGHGKEKGA